MFQQKAEYIVRSYAVNLVNASQYSPGSFSINCTERHFIQDGSRSLPRATRRIKALRNSRCATQHWPNINRTEE
ncbi:hypothetical protein VCV18_002306 [Metarhizium anisopliae]